MPIQVEVLPKLPDVLRSTLLFLETHFTDACIIESLVLLLYKLVTCEVYKRHALKLLLQVFFVYPCHTPLCTRRLTLPQFCCLLLASHYPALILLLGVTAVVPGHAEALMQLPS